MSHSTSHRAAGAATARKGGLVIALVALVLGLVVGVASGVLADRLIGSDSRSGESGVENDLRRIEGERLSALLAADMGVVSRLHAKEFTLVPEQGYPMARDAYLTAVESGALDYQTLEPVSDIEVQVEGDAAVLWYRSRIGVVAAGEGSFTYEAWQVCVYEKSQGDWQVVREQTTAVGGFPPPGAGS
jgi:ketosteroid isomerase-like protein